MKHSILDLLNYDDYLTLLDILHEWGDSPEEMQECYLKALTLIKSFEYLPYLGNETEFNRAVFFMLEEIVCEQVEDFINYRWDFKSYSTLEFVKLLRDPITALGYTYVLVLKSKGDNNDGASSSYVH